MKIDREQNATPLAPAMAGVIVLVMCIKAGTVVASKVAVNDVAPTVAVFYRTACGAASVFLVCVAWRRLPCVPWRLGRWAWLAAGLYAANLSVYYWGCALTDAARAAVIMNLQPFLVALFAAWAHGEDAVTPTKLAGMALAFGGVLAVIGGDVVLGRGRAGDLIIVCSTTLWAIQVVVEKHALPRLPRETAALSLVFWEFACVAGVQVVRLAISGDALPVHMAPATAGALLFMGTIGTCVFIVEKAIVRATDVSLVMSFNFLMPILGVLLSVALLGEHAGPHLLAGLTLVTLGIAVVTVPWRARRPLPAAVMK